ncbi:MAG: purine-nucleoside phosphorylase [Saprospiraceae bacterium]|nr:purine-nucleoside phosphorylase [Saprospiraceae bacterium]
MTLFDKITESGLYIRSKISEPPFLALVLGTGLGQFAETLDEVIRIPYHEIPHFPVSTVQSHQGMLVFGYKHGVPIIALSGRFHYYEGYSAAEVTFPVRVLKELGAEMLIITNAAGGINPHFEEGDIVIISDHINLMPDHPLRGQNDDRLGLRFPDMLQAYDVEELNEMKHLAEVSGIKLKSGVYLGLQGPSLETPAEYKMGHILGADMVGMSTVPEVIVARHCGLKVIGFSIISNTCFPKSHLSETTVEDVVRVVTNSAGQLDILLDSYIKSIKHKH